MYTTIEINGATKLQGVSIGGVHTALALPSLGIGFDVGMAIRSHVGIDHLFITHTHSDHIGALPAFLGMRDLLTDKRLNIYVGYDDVDHVRDIVALTGRLGRYEPRVVVQAIRAGDLVRLNNQTEVHAFNAHHVLPCLGYKVVRTVQKLRPEFRGLPGQEIARLRKEGTPDMFDVVTDTEFAFVTDTVATVFDAEPSLRDARTLVCESTFLCDEYPEARARAYSHMHAREVLEALRGFSGDLVLTHFSLAYSPVKVREYVAHVFKDTGINVRPFLPSGDSWSEW